ncbi:MAG: penicillin-binding protein 2 [Bdellovibrionales bacterium]|nr:penicillin-binding protein 2 [Bdellovibrionales bacterium]
MRTSRNQFIGRDYSRFSASSSVDTMSIDGKRFRLWGILFFILLWVSLLIFRLYTLQVSEFSQWRTSAMKQHVTTIELASERGPILDRNGKLLAVSVPAGSVYVRPGQVKNKEEAIDQVARALHMSESAVRDKFESDSPFVWIKRQVPKVHAEQVEGLGIKGVGYLLESRRYYPYNRSASTLLGKVGVDGKGLSGIEAVYEEYLQGEATRAHVSRDGFGKEIEIPIREVASRSLPKGDPLALTLDARVQHIMEEELEQGRVNANAKRAMSVMLDAETGEILGLAQSPSINFNTERVRSRDQLKNMVLETIFEPGSIMKPFVAAVALEQGAASVNDVIDCEQGSFAVGRHMIHDVHPSGAISFHQVVVRSSNIGMTKIGMRLGKAPLHQGLRSFGFGESTGLNLPGETGGILRKPDTWANVDVATHSFGQGIAVTPLQLVRGVSSIANGGYLPQVKIIQDGSGPQLQRVLSPETSRRVREMMYGVVEDEHGTGSKAKISGVRIGGKTGTAQRVREDGRGYEPGSYTASFVGFVDGQDVTVDRKLSLIVVIDQPNTTSIYGGTLAAPVFRKIMHRTLHTLSTQGEESAPQFVREGPYQAQREEGMLRRVSYRP